MKYIILFLPLLLFGGEYYGKVEPYETYTISSKVSGLVTYTNEALISKIADDSAVIKIDDELAKKNYNIALSTYNTQSRIYNNILKVRSKPQMEKDNTKLAVLRAKQSLVNAKDSFQHRTIKAKGLYVAEILVKKGNFISPGTPLVKAYDISHSKIIIYISKEDLEGLENRKILVNKKEEYKIHKYFKIADSVHITSYKVELIGKAPKEFSKIAKVEIQ